MRRKDRGRPQNNIMLYLFVLIGLGVAIFTFSAGQSLSEMAQVVSDAQHRTPSQFEMIMESRQTNPPEQSNGRALPLWSIILLFLVAIIFALWQGSSLLVSLDKLVRGIKKRGKSNSRSLLPSPWQIRPGASHRPSTSDGVIAPVRPLLEAPKRSTDNQDTNDSIDDVGWA